MEKLIIGIAGEADSGKSTVANILIERGFIRGKFAGALKEMFRALLRYRGVEEGFIERCVEGDLKEQPLQELGGKSPRHVMQWLGQSGRENIDEDFWIDVEFDSKSNDNEQNLLFDDLRYDNEEAAITKRGGVIIHLVGRGGIDSDHISERFKPKLATVIDNSGTVEELREKVNEFADDFSWAA